MVCSDSERKRDMCDVLDTDGVAWGGNWGVWLAFSTSAVQTRALRLARIGYGTCNGSQFHHCRFSSIINFTAVILVLHSKDQLRVLSQKENNSTFAPQHDPHHLEHEYPIAGLARGR